MNYKNPYYLQNSLCLNHIKNQYNMRFTIFFLYINMTNNYYQIHKEKLRKEEACE